MVAIKIKQEATWLMAERIPFAQFFLGLFAVFYLHDLITYSCTKCIEML